ncbi:hypothetical protein [Primorskyibacter sp. S187A]|uniref:hypothetical protein n=1 Tax=Primorskyibacter sp. S187A TaxID=3415130 RepID=UPI003C7B78CD
MAKRLRWAGFPGYVVRVLHGAELPGQQIAGKLAGTGLASDVAEAYAAKMKSGASAVIVRATYKPLGAARIAREIFAESKAIDLGLAGEDARVPDLPDHAPSVLKDHPRFLTAAPDPDAAPARPVTEVMGWRMLMPHRQTRSVMTRTKPLSAAFWPMPLISIKPRKSSVIRGGRLVSRSFWPQPLLRRSDRRASVMREGEGAFSRLFGLPLLSKRRAGK